ncbi:MAG: PAS domain-containing protein [Bacteroidetes bacterium]|nr:PAS domain-containing protein [Bacteroidota bacterium]
MEFIENLDGAVIVSDADGTIVYLNDRAANNFQKEGGRSLIGKNLKDCHKDYSNDKIREMMQSHEKNVYTIEKKGKKKLIYQAPWYHQGAFGGLVELSLEIPFEMPHFKRD